MSIESEKSTTQKLTDSTRSGADSAQNDGKGIMQSAQETMGNVASAAADNVKAAGKQFDSASMFNSLTPQQPTMSPALVQRPQLPKLSTSGDTPFPLISYGKWRDGLHLLPTIGLDGGCISIFSLKAAMDLIGLCFDGWLSSSQAIQ